MEGYTTVQSKLIITDNCHKVFVTDSGIGIAYCGSVTFRDHTLSLSERLSKFVTENTHETNGEEFAQKLKVTFSELDTIGRNFSFIIATFDKASPKIFYVLFPDQKAEPFIIKEPIGQKFEFDKCIGYSDRKIIEKVLLDAFSFENKESFDIAKLDLETINVKMCKFYNSLNENENLVFIGGKTKILALKPDNSFKWLETHDSPIKYR